MTTSQIHEFARMGAEARLKAISEEQEAILRSFPALRDGAAPARREPARKGRRRMSPAERKAVGDRMRAYWAKRRTEKGGAAKRKRQGGMSAEARKAQGERMKAYWTAKRVAKVDGAGQGTQSKTAGQNGAPSSTRPGKTGRKRMK